MSLIFLQFNCSNHKICCEPYPPEINPFIFGTFYGHCQGVNCIRIFKIENYKLYEDTLDIVPYHGTLSGQFKLLPDSLYHIAKHLPSAFPHSLVSDNIRVYGCPDCGDWGGIYLEIPNGSKNRSWLIDLNKSNLPAELIPFRDELEKVVLKL